MSNFNIADLTQILYTAMSGVSANIFTDRPLSVPTSMTDFVVTKFPSAVYDKLAIGHTSCIVSIYARDITVNNIVYENMAKLKTMQQAVYNKLPISDNTCIISKPTPINGGSDKLGFHCIHIHLSVLIK